MAEPGPNRPFTSIAFDGRIDLAEASERLKWPEVRRYAYGSIYQIEGSGHFYLFDFGAFVHDGAPKLDQSVLKIVEDATRRRALPETAETYYVVVDPEHAAHPRVAWDRVVIPSAAPELLGAVALLLGQSAALERYEKSTDELLDEVLLETRRLSSTGRAPRANRLTLRKIGAVTEDRLEIASLFYLLDRPEETWENSTVADLYDKLFRNLELEQRHEAISSKLAAVEKAVQSIIDIWQNRVSNRLEWTIIVLIVIEIALALLGRQP